ncbi:MAG: hypothetical protein ABR568_01935 [Pyrinomonadaceae bacterium]
MPQIRIVGQVGVKATSRIGWMLDERVGLALLKYIKSDPRRPHEVR